MGRSAETIYALPVTDDPADRKVRVNIDLALWIPEGSTKKDAAREFLRNPFVGVVTDLRPDGSPHSTVVWVDVEDPPETTLKEILGSGHSRFPASRGEVDEVLADRALHRPSPAARKGFSRESSSSVTV